MADRDQPQQPTHRAYSVIKREGQEDFWLNLGLAFPHPTKVERVQRDVANCVDPQSARQVKK
jgi:hypothetical protein